MAHSRNKPGREKKKPKKEKLSTAKIDRGNEVLQHVSQQTRPSEETG